MIRELDAEVKAGRYINGQAELVVDPIKVVINPDGARVEMNRVSFAVGARRTSTLVRANQRGHGYLWQVIDKYNLVGLVLEPSPKP